MDIRLQQFSALVDLINIPVFILEVGDHEDVRFVKLNTSHEEATGLLSSQVSGKMPGDFLPSRLAETILSNYRTCIRRRAVYSYEEVLDFPSGELWWYTTLSPIFSESGTVVGIFGIAHNITSYKTNEFNATRSVVALRKLNDDLTMFTSMAAHDLRAPLRQLCVISDLLREDFQDLGDDKMELVTTIASISDKALHKLDDVMAYSRSITLQPAAVTTVDFGHLCSDLVAILDPFAKLDIRYPAIHILVEEVTLQIILRNLLDNAVRFTKSKISISVTAFEAKGEWLHFSLSDDGPGFQGQYETFEQSSVSAVQNDGYGLAAVKQLVNTRGGRLWLDGDHTTVGATLHWTAPGRLLS